LDERGFVAKVYSFSVQSVLLLFRQLNSIKVYWWAMPTLLQLMIIHQNAIAARVAPLEAIALYS